MKKIIFAVVTIVNCCLLFSCKKENPTPAVNNKKTHCYKILDELSHHPIQGAYVNAVYLDPYYLPYSGLTDSLGNFCFETSTEATEADLIAIKFGYVNFCYSLGETTIYLTPVAFLKLHIKNTAPKSVSDQIFITYPSSDCNGSEIINYSGTNINTTVILPANPLANFISWNSWHNNINTESTLNDIQLNSGDTTFLEVIY